MKKFVVTAFHITLFAVGWMILSWLFVNSPAIGAQPNTPAVASAGQAGDDFPADQHHGMCGKQMHHKKHFGQFLKKLNLTAEQKTQVKQIMTEEREKIKPLAQSLKEQRKELRDLTKGGAFDEQKVRAAASKQANTMTDLIVARERMKSRIFAVLTPEQRDKAEQMHQKWMEGKKEGKKAKMQ